MRDTAFGLLRRVATTPADRAWLFLAGAVIAWDALCPEGQKLTESARRHPNITFFGVAIIGAHLNGSIPDRFDPIHRLAQLTGHARETDH